VIPTSGVTGGSAEALSTIGFSAPTRPAFMPPAIGGRTAFALRTPFPRGPALAEGTAFALRTACALSPALRTTFPLAAGAMGASARRASRARGPRAGRPGRRAAGGAVAVAAASTATTTAGCALGAQHHGGKAFRSGEARDVIALQTLNGAELLAFRRLHEGPSHARGAMRAVRPMRWT